MIPIFTFWLFLYLREYIPLAPKVFRYFMLLCCLTTILISFVEFFTYEIFVNLPQDNLQNTKEMERFLLNRCKLLSTIYDKLYFILVVHIFIWVINYNNDRFQYDDI